MHVYSICTSGTIGRELAENRARTCMLGLSSLQISWPVSGWILKLFLDIMERLKNKLSKTSILDPIRLSQSSRISEATQTERLGQFRSFPRSYNSSGPLTPNQSVGGRTNASELGSVLSSDTTVSEDGANYLLPLSEQASLDYEFLPDMFVLDQSLQDSQMGQGNFFDLLRVPDWDNADLVV